MKHPQLSLKFLLKQASILILTLSLVMPVILTQPATTVYADKVGVCAVPGKDGPNAALTGIVNTYYPGTANAAIGATAISVGAAVGGGPAIAAGDLLLVVQMQGADLDGSNDERYGDGVGTAATSGNTVVYSAVNAYAGGNLAANFSAGNYEYVVATGPVAAGSVPISSGLVNDYFNANYVTQGQRRFQVIRVPQYSSATLTGAVTAPAWNGNTGGIVAFDVAGALNWGNQTINVNGLGFRGGGARQLGGGAGADTDYRTLSTVNANGSKGEGYAGTPRYVNNGGVLLDNGAANEGFLNGSYGRGASGNGGGGSTDGNPAANDQNSGGGGGGNGGAGGMGGNAWQSGDVRGGFGGAPFPGSAPRLILGGGGGAGTTNNGTGTPGTGFASSGAAGGGVVMVRAGTIAGIGTINANGATANQTVLQDGGGGGGAGGSVVVIARNGAGAVGTLTVTAQGGNGGLAWPGQTVNADRHGPGGGGGGGFVFTSGAVAGASSVAGGTNGTTINPPQAYGATPGLVGQLVTTVTPASIPDSISGANCVPVTLTTTKTTSTPSVVAGATATYTIDVSNAAGAGGASGVDISDVLPAGFTYASTGAVNLLGNAVRTVTTDPVAGTGTPAWGTFLIPGGSSVTITFTVNVNIATPPATYQNPATATFLDPVRTVAATTLTSTYNSASSTGEDVTITAPPSADLVVTKTNGVASVGAGGTTTYTLTLTNNGPDAANNSTIQDAAAVGLTKTAIGACTAAGGAVCPTVGAGAGQMNIANLQAGTVIVPTLPNGGSISFSVTANVTATNGNVTNIFLATPPAGTIDPTPATVSDIDAVTSLLVTKSSSAGGTVNPGGTVTYAIAITNNGSATQNNIVVTDVLPTGTTFVSGSVDGFRGTSYQYLDNFSTGTAYNQTAGTSNWSGQSWTETGDDGNSTTGTITISDANNRLQLNAAAGDYVERVIPGNLTGKTVSLIIDYEEVGNWDNGDFFYVDVWDGSAWQNIVTLENDFNNPAAETYDISTYANANTRVRFMSTANAGGENAYVTSVSVAYDDFAVITGAAINNPPNVILAADNFDLPVGSTMTITYQVTVNSPVVGGQTQVINTASVTSVETITPAQAMVTDNINNTTADLVVTKTDGVATVNAGGTTTYTLTLTNNGPSAANNSTISDAVAVGLTKTAIGACTVAGGAVCPTVGAGAGQMNIANLEAGTVAVPTLPSGGSISFTITATVTATTGNVANIFTATPPVGTTDPTPATVTDTDAVNPIADLVVTKTDGVATVNAGGTTTYTLTFTNNGPSAANASTIQDAVAVGLTKTAIGACTAAGGAVCPTVGAGAGQMNIANLETGTVVVPTLPNGGSISFSVTATVTATTGNVANIFTATPPVGTTDPTPATVTDTDNVNPIANLSITKTDGVANVNAGGTTTYTIVVANAGPSAADGAVFTDPVVAGLTATAVTCGTATGGAACPTVANTTVALMQGAGIVIPTLPSGGSVTFTVNATVTAVGGNVANMASIATPVGTTDPTPANNIATDTDTVIAPNLSLVKSNGTTTVIAGGTTTYTLTVTNNGNAPTSGSIMLVDVLPVGLSIANGPVALGGAQSADWTCIAATNVVPCGSSTVIAVGGMSVFSFTVTVDANATGPLLNKAQVGGGGDPTNPSGPTSTTAGQCTATDIPNEGCAVDSGDTVSLIANLSITKTDGVASVNAGGTTTYTIVVTNAGPSPADGAVFTDPVVAGLTATGVTCGTATGGAACPTVANTTVALMQGAGIVIPTLPSGGSVTFTLNATVTAVGGNVANVASIATPAGTTDPTPANNTATDTDTVTPIADLVITKTDGVATVNAGGTTTYTLTLANNGPSSANNSTLQDAVAAGLTKTAIGACTAAGGAVCPTVGGGAGQMNIANLEAGTVIAPTLPSGGSISFTISASVTATTGSVANIFTATPPVGTTDPTPATATDTDNVIEIIAVNDSGNTVNGTAGGQSFANVLTNDSLNGTSPVLLADVNLTQVSTTNAGVTLNPADGSVNVAAGTPAGNYTVTYQICDKLNPTFCDTATVTVPVVTINAVNDTGTTVNGTAGGTAVANALTNDTLNGVAVAIANVNLTPVGVVPAGITFNTATGAVTVAAGTAAGSYTFDYQICDKLNPAICGTATVTVPVVTINAVNDTGTTVNGTAGGTAVANVLTNDTLNGVAATIANVDITLVGALPAGITFNTATGAVTIAAGTPGGTYNFDYQICDQLNATICDTATVTVPVVTINAVNDTGTTVNGTVGGTAVANVLTNDTLNGVAVVIADVNLTPVGVVPAGITFNTATGAVTVAAGTASGSYTFDYQICDKLNPAICDTATVTVPVGTINAVNDTGTTVNGTAGGTAVANVLTNDALNGVAVAIADVNLTPVGVVPAGITFNTATGAVTVAAGTAAGSYTFDYQICDKLNPAICGTATVTVPVVTINAVNDTGTTVNGTAGGTALANVLTNDTLNGAAVAIANVNLTPVGVVPAGITFNTATGAVTVAAGTAAGSYTFDYQICDKLNPAICDTATVTVPVGTINAVNDTGTTVNGTAGGTALANVLTNDTLNGVAATVANVDITLVGALPAGLTFNTATGAVTVAAGTAAGSYTFDYQICDKLNPAICDTATVTVPVVTINAVNDTGTTVNGTTGGTAVANVLTNDTLNGVAATVANVDITLVGALPAGLTFNTATGAVTVAAGTPAGSYTFDYQICDKLNPAICDTATVTVPVGTITAVNDTGTTVNGTAGGTAVANVLTNDTLNGVAATVANVDITLVGALPAGLTFNTATGAVTVAAGTAAGSYTFDYQICDKLNPAICDTATVTVPVGTINAVNDTGTTVNGTAGGTAVANVLTNDTLNGVAATVANVDITLVGALPAGITFNTATGAVTVAAGTAAGSYTFDYQICDKLNPAICDTATVTVPVVTINAVNDTGAGVDGAVGGTSIANVLTNDTLNGVAATIANVDITLVGALPAGLTFNTATGAVTVAAGTPGGTYTFDYQICDKLNATICDTATETVPVLAVNAVDDTGVTLDGAVGGTAVANVLTNDTLNGAAAIVANVDITLVGALPAGLAFNTATGAVTVAAGTAAGSYTFDYQICDKLNAAICDTATVTVPVGTINAVNDTGAKVNGVLGGTAVANVLTNDTLNGVAATVANVDITPVGVLPAGITLNTATGAVTIVAGTTAGSYTFDYQICDQLNPAICDTATVTVPVLAIDAVNDTGSTINGAAGGTAIANVLVNDSLNAVSPVLLANVNLTQISTTNAGVTLNPADGSVNVAVGTAAGSYTVTYQICDKLNPTICDTAIVTVNVVSGGIAKTITGTSEADTLGNDVAIGEIVTYQITIDLPAGTAFNNVIVTDRMDKGLAFVDCLSVTLVGVNVTGAVCPPTVSAITNPGDSAANPANAGRQVQFNIGNIPAPVAASTLVIQYRAIALDVIENQNNVKLNNNVTWSWAGGSLSTSAPDVTIVEPDMSITKSAAPSNNVAVGTPILFTLTIAHTAASSADAFDVVVTDDILPAGLVYVPCTVTYAGLAPTPVVPDPYCPAAPATLTFVWDTFPLGQSATITFNARLAQPSVTNTASLAWTSLLIDPAGVPPLPVQLSTHNPTSTERAYDPGDPVDVYGVSSSVRINPPAGTPATPADLPDALPATGFAPNVVTILPKQPKEKLYAATDVWVEIPSLGVSIPIVGVPLADGDWDVSWLEKQAGWLEGTAFPGWAGNSALTGHVYLSNGKPGPFVDLAKLKWGDKIIVHAYGSVYTYEVRENRTVGPTNTSVLKHEDDSWLTLITCKSYNETTDKYASRTAVRAALVSVKLETTPKSAR